MEIIGKLSAPWKKIGKFGAPLEKISKLDALWGKTGKLGSPRRKLVNSAYHGQKLVNMLRH